MLIVQLLLFLFHLSDFFVPAFIFNFTTEVCSQRQHRAELSSSFSPAEGLPVGSSPGSDGSLPLPVAFHPQAVPFPAPGSWSSTHCISTCTGSPSAGLLTLPALATTQFTHRATCSRTPSAGRGTSGPAHPCHETVQPFLLGLDPHFSKKECCAQHGQEGRTKATEKQLGGPQARAAGSWDSDTWWDFRWVLKLKSAQLLCGIGEKIKQFRHHL